MEKSGPITCLLLEVGPGSPLGILAYLVKWRTLTNDFNILTLLLLAGWSEDNSNLFIIIIIIIVKGLISELRL